MIKTYKFKGGFFEKNIILGEPYFSNINSDLQLTKNNESEIYTIETVKNNNLVEEIISYLNYSYIKDINFNLYLKKNDYYYLLFSSYNNFLNHAYGEFKSFVIDNKFHISEQIVDNVDKIIIKSPYKINLLDINTPFYLKLIFILKLNVNIYFETICEVYKPIHEEKVIKKNNMFNKNNIYICLIEKLFQFKEVGKNLICSSTINPNILDLFIKTGNLKFLFDEIFFGTNNESEINFNINFDINFEEIEKNINDIRDEIYLNKKFSEIIKDKKYNLNKSIINEYYTKIEIFLNKNITLKNDLLYGFNYILNQSEYTLDIIKKNIDLQQSQRKLIKIINANEDVIFKQLILEIIRLKIYTDNCFYSFKEFLLSLYISDKLDQYEEEMLIDSNKFNSNIVLHDFIQLPEVINNENIELFELFYKYKEFKVWTHRKSSFEINSEKISYPNCGENTLLHLFNYMIYNPVNKKLDFTKLPESTLDELKDFYKKNNTINKVDKNFQKFDEIIRSLEFIKHSDLNSDVSKFSIIDKKPIGEIKVNESYTGYDINPSYFNIIRVLNKLLGSDVYPDEKIFLNGKGTELENLLKMFKIKINFMHKNENFIKIKRDDLSEIISYLGYSHAEPEYKNNLNDYIYIKILNNLNVSDKFDWYFIKTLNNYNNNLCIAIINNSNETIIKKILDKILKQEDKINLINQKDEFDLDFNSLHIAVNNSNLKVIDAILNQIEDDEDKIYLFSQKNRMNNNVLDIALKKSNEKVIETILNQIKQQKFKIDLISQKDRNDNNILHLASLNKNENVIRTILNQITDGKEKVNLISQTNRFGNNVIYLAVMNPNVIKVILDQITDQLDKINLINKLNKDGETLLDLAVKNSNENVIRTILDQIIDQLDKIDLINQLNKDYENILDIAVNNSNEKLIKTILDQIKDDRDKKKLIFDNNLLQIAASNKNENIIKVILEQIEKTDDKIYLISKVDQYDKTVLHLASENKNENVIKTILDKITNYTDKIKLISQKYDYDGKTVLHIAVENSNSNVIKTILEQIINYEDIVKLISQKYKYDYYLLHIAAKNQNEEVIKTILDKITNYEDKIKLISQKDIKGKNVLEIAESNSNNNVIKILLYQLNDKIDFKNKYLKYKNKYLIMKK